MQPIAFNFTFYKHAAPRAALIAVKALKILNYLDAFARRQGATE